MCVNVLKWLIDHSWHYRYLLLSWNAMWSEGCGSHWAQAEWRRVHSDSPHHLAHSKALHLNLCEDREHKRAAGENVLRSLDMKDFTLQQIDMHTKTKSGKNGKTSTLAASLDNGEFPLNKGDGLTTSVSTWELLVPKCKTSKTSSETTSKIWPQFSVQETKLDRGRF